MYNYLQDLGFNTLTDTQEQTVKIQPNKNILLLGCTGSGKTEASYNWLLNNKKKGIIIEPRILLATDLCKRLNQYSKKLNLEKWIVQHSNSNVDKFLSNKYCVTTIDQVLSGYLGIGTQSFIRGKNVVSSDLIFDEVQLLELNKTFLTTINMLDNIYKLNINNFMIMTATMPQYLIDFLVNRYNMEVVISLKESVKKNIILHYLPLLDYNEINNYNDKQIFICNSQKEQETIFNNIKNKDRIIVLNNYLLPTDRKKVEEKVLKFFGKQSHVNNTILITTQIVEAGMDISSARVYSANAPIDSIIQRMGRCVRWGGNGDFYVFESKNFVYDEEVVQATNHILQENNNTVITWDKQRQWCNLVLNDYYKKNINKLTIRQNKVKLLNNKREDLIRDIRNVNIIVQNTKMGIISDMFNKESVSIDILKLQRMNNEKYKMIKSSPILTTYKDIDIGDTIVISNENCTYDTIGFRIIENEYCEPFQYDNDVGDNNKIVYRNYLEESWLSHAKLTKKCMEKNLRQYMQIDYIKDNYDKICTIAGLHDLGKIDEKWIEWSGGDGNKVLAHFPFTKKRFTYKNRKHNYISAYVLRDNIDNILFNMVLQHHKRVVAVDSNLYIDEFSLYKQYIELLKEYGYNISVKNYENTVVIQGNEVIAPHIFDYIIFLILTGVLMESDIEAINTYLDLNES